MKLLFENLPASLEPQRQTLRLCLEAMNRVMSLRAVYLFGSHACGDARPGRTATGICASWRDGAEKQLEAAQSYTRAWLFSELKLQRSS